MKDKAVTPAHSKKEKIALLSKYFNSSFFNLETNFKLTETTYKTALGLTSMRSD